MISSRYPNTNPNGITYLSTSEALGIIRFDSDDKGYHDLATALRDGKVWLTLKTYKYGSYPILQFVVRIYKPGSNKPFWWGETLGDITHGDIQNFIIDILRNRKWKLAMSRYDPIREQESDEMIELHEREFVVSQEDISRFTKETQIAIKHFQAIPVSKRDFAVAARKLMEDNPPVEGIQ